MSFSPVHPAHLAYVRSSHAALNDFSIPSHSAVAHTDNGTDTDTDTDTNTNTDTGTGRGRGRGTDTGTGTDTRKFSKMILAGLLYNLNLNPHRKRSSECQPRPGVLQLRQAVKEPPWITDISFRLLFVLEYIQLYKKLPWILYFFSFQRRIMIHV